MEVKKDERCKTYSKKEMIGKEKKVMRIGKEWDVERKRVGCGKEKNGMRKEKEWDAERKGKECFAGGAWLIERKGGRLRKEEKEGGSHRTYTVQ